MKNLDYLNVYRLSLYGESGDSFNGAFKIKIHGEEYGVIASNGAGWDHVSVSHKSKIPSWKTMCAVKKMFFEDNEVVIQIHPAKQNYVNVHPNCLHLWKSQRQNIDLPPLSLV
jgi:hypothetical protein